MKIIKAKKLLLIFNLKENFDENKKIKKRTFKPINKTTENQFDQ